MYTKSNQLISLQNPFQQLMPFALRWLSITEDDFFPISQLPEALPETLKRVYQIAKSKPDILHKFQKQDYLLDVDELRFYEDRVVFLVENQGCWTCETEIYQADPAIYVNHPQLKKDKSETKLVHERLSAFLTTFVLQELTLSSEYVFFEIDDLTFFDEKGLLIQPLWLDAPHVWTGMKAHFHLINDSILTMIDEDSGTGFAGTQNEAMYDLLTEIGGEI
ncbi:hypothetical protein QNI16_33830 [Cytophagaceae bacterium YF14B1]|uniref:Uncharacterized protein n=1 Tax=Xanthocytophaga flava TaxID=3048013 RepID=A0AAE3QU54_9BACT|nr:hypothetical protein [Xanthocytophaga flavus]MDJ1485520.1 hypothetical protein [Xanthocytophaga flavus]